MKRFILMLTIASISLANYAQSKISLGLEGGGGISFLSPNLSNSLHPCFYVGANFQYDITESISVRSGLGFEDKRTGHEVLVQDEFGNPLHDYEFESSFKYLSIPLLIRKSFGENVKFLVNAGLNFGFLNQQKTMDLNDNTESTILTDYYKTFGLGLLIGVGTLIPINEKIDISCELRNNLDLTPINESIPEGSSKKKFNATHLLIGINYYL